MQGNSWLKEILGSGKKKWQEIFFGMKLAENIMNCQDNGRKLLDSNHWGLIIVIIVYFNFQTPEINKDDNRKSRFTKWKHLWL
jgi:hypothetical protein